MPGAAAGAGGGYVDCVLKRALDRRRPTLVTSATLPASTWLLKNVYGIVIADGSGKNTRITR